MINFVQAVKDNQLDRALDLIKGMETKKIGTQQKCSCRYGTYIYNLRLFPVEIAFVLDRIDLVSKILKTTGSVNKLPDASPVFSMLLLHHPDPSAQCNWYVKNKHRICVTCNPRNHDLEAYCRMFTELGANINQVDNHKKTTTLWRAVLTRNLPTVKALLKFGADPNFTHLLPFKKHIGNCFELAVQLKQWDMATLMFDDLKNPTVNLDMLHHEVPWTFVAKIILKLPGSQRPKGLPHLAKFDCPQLAKTRSKIRSIVHMSRGDISKETARKLWNHEAIRTSCLKFRISHLCHLRIETMEQRNALTIAWAWLYNRRKAGKPETSIHAQTPGKGLQVLVWHPYGDANILKIVHQFI
jgi:hypothetical protein